jgi:quinoprotein glucose dehydrogenase
MPDRRPGRLLSVLATLLATAISVAGQSSRFRAGPQDGDWTAYGRDAGGERFSPIDVINRTNVASLQVAWTFRTGDAYQPPRGRPTAFEATPLYVDGTLYLSTPLGRVIALDPSPGRQRVGVRCEGVIAMGLWRLREPRRCRCGMRGRERRIFVATIDARLIALDASTGRPIQGFGASAIVDLRQGTAASHRQASQTIRSLASMPSSATDCRRLGDSGRRADDRAGGEIRAFDAVTGALKWRWDPIPQDPKAVGADTWRRASARDGRGECSASVIVADPGASVFVPTSSPSPDYYRRRAVLGDNCL